MGLKLDRGLKMELSSKGGWDQNPGQREKAREKSSGFWQTQRKERESRSIGMGGEPRELGD